MRCPRVLVSDSFLASQKDAETRSHDRGETAVVGGGSQPPPDDNDIPTVTSRLRFPVNSDDEESDGAQAD